MNVFRFYNQNRYVFWIIVIAIILFIIAIHLINAIIEKEISESKNIVIIDEKKYENKIDIKEQVTNEQVQEDEELIIDQFIKYCNKNDIQNAYNILTEECKNNLFPTIEDFNLNYVQKNFSSEKLFSKSQYMGNTYKVVFYENLLTTGIDSKEKIEDYYTIVRKEDNSYKLNICNYIKQKKLNGLYKDDKIKIEVTKKDVYKEYEIYRLEVTNQTNKNILLDTKKSTKSIYLVDEKNMIYNSSSYEILDSNLLIRPNLLNIINIKIVRDYSETATKRLIFEDVIYDYIENTDKTKYNKTTINVGV